MASEELVEQWFDLTRVTMPSLARQRDWPVRLDHCFQRILLDNAVGAAWRTVIVSPAYRNATDQQLRAAITLGNDVVAGNRDLTGLNRKSLDWRGKLPH